MPEREPSAAALSARKADHLALCAEGEVGFDQKTTLLEEVELVHDALPDRALDEVDLRTPFAGRTLRAPLIIAAMTGGTERAELVNRDLARVAEEEGIGFAFGSQRPLLTRGVEAGYRVRDLAPTTLVLGNIGVVQARETPTAALREMLDRSGADALCVHLNPAQELAQPEGDRDFRGGLDTLRRLVAELDRPVIVKETGCGLSRAVGERLWAAGVRRVDVSGAGGTSWVQVEALRAAGDQRRLAERFRDWGIPTAASVAQLSGLGLEVVATGGVSHGLDAARALALGARCVGVARPFLKAQTQGLDALRAAVRGMVAEMRVACLLAGASSPTELATRPVVLGAQLRRWVPPESPLRARVLGGV